MLSNTPQWVAAYTNSRAEKKMEEVLRNSGYEVYLPLKRTPRKWSDRIKMVDMPLLPSYLFIRIIGKQVVPLRSTPGIVTLIHFKGDIAVVPDRDIEAMKKLVQSQQNIVVQNYNKMRKGTRVRITHGSFSGLEGEVVSDNKDGNFAVIIECLSVSLVTTINHEFMEVIEPPTQANNLKSNRWNL